MVKAVILVDQMLSISERFRAEIKLFEVKKSKKHPTGIRVKFVLIDVIKKVLRLLIDNHEPFGFHVHEELPDNKDARRLLDTEDHMIALNEFWRLAKEITHDENEIPQNYF